MDPNQLSLLGFDLEALAVFRALLDDPVVAPLTACIQLSADDADPFELASAYSTMLARLYASGAPSLAAYVRDAVLEDENAYLVRSGAGEEIAPGMEEAVARELATLQQVADLAPEDLLAALPDELVDRMSRFQVEHVDLEAQYAERLANIGTRGYGMYARNHVFSVDREGQIVPVRYPDPIRLSDLVDYERERKVIMDNTLALLAGKPAANILLTGDAGTGKSSTVKAVVNELYAQGLRILEVRKEQLHHIPAVLEALTRNPLKFIIFIDDLSFSSGDDNFAAMKAILEGSVSAKSDNVVIYATSNRRHLVRERFSDREGDEIHLNDTMQEIISLSDRFGIRVSFYKPNKDTYLNIVHKLAADAGIEMDQDELDLAAERFSTRRGGRSARGARQFVDSLLAARD